VVFNIPFLCDYITKLCRTQAEVILNHVIPNVRDIGQEKLGTGSTRGLKLAAVRPTTVHLTPVSKQLSKLRHNLLQKPALTGSLCIACVNVT
jgi:hypothetical protein